MHLRVVGEGEREERGEKEGERVGGGGVRDLISSTTPINTTITTPTRLVPILLRLVFLYFYSCYHSPTAHKHKSSPPPSSWLPVFPFSFPLPPFLFFLLLLRLSPPPLVPDERAARGHHLQARCHRDTNTAACVPALPGLVPRQPGPPRRTCSAPPL